MTKAEKKSPSTRTKKPSKTSKPVNLKQIKKPAPEPQAAVSKQDTIINLLKSPAGATIEEISKAIGWQRHSVYGVLSGSLKKKLKLSNISAKEERGRVYRIEGKC